MFVLQPWSFRIMSCVPIKISFHVIWVDISVEYWSFDLMTVIKFGIRYEVFLGIILTGFYNGILKSYIVFWLRHIFHILVLLEFIGSITSEFILVNGIHSVFFASNSYRQLNNTENKHIFPSLFHVSHVVEVVDRDVHFISFLLPFGAAADAMSFWCEAYLL